MAAKRLSEIRKGRLKKATQLREIGINPYPSKINIPGDLITINTAKESLGKAVKVAGRLFSIREHGKVTFMDLKDSTGQIQLLFQQKLLTDTYGLIKFLDSGDFLAVNGEVIKTQAGEITVNVGEFQLLSKAIRPLPDEWYGLKDIEVRYRKRYIDLLLNPEVRERFNTRTLLVREIRRYLESLNYWEVETPVLQPLYGGANAKPFKTHINALDEEMYLRIADELYLKRLIVGGYERVYEISKDFRNEGMDLVHNPEFTMIEFYEAYADYNRMMDVTEGLFKHLAQAIYGKTQIMVGDKSIDIGGNWKRITMRDLISEKLKLDIEKESVESLIKFAKKKKVELLGGETKGQLVYTIFEHLLTDTLIEPTWVLDYPKDVSPLSKDKENFPGLVERFEGYIGGKEISDGWSELTDPMEQRQRFETDIKVVRSIKEDAQPVDEDFLEALEYGMPPLGGIGIGIDRMAMFFTNTWSIKEVILFNTMRPLKNKRI